MTTEVSVLRTVNAALLDAFDAWCSAFGVRAAVSAFNIPAVIGEAIHTDEEMKEPFLDWPVSLFAIEGPFGAWEVDEALADNPACQPAMAMLWKAQEAYFQAVRDNLMMAGELSLRDFRLSEEQAASIACRSSSDLSRLARTALPVLHFRDDVLTGFDAASMSSLLFSTFVQENFIDLDDSIRAE